MLTLSNRHLVPVDYVCSDMRSNVCFTYISHFNYLLPAAYLEYESFLVSFVETAMALILEPPQHSYHIL